ncbi:hypothetical protein VB264_14790 [Arcicella aquatica]|uniref:ABC-type phosphate transport system substrate-binding protein n=1 Tax=Arcicella aquatica TaxID=217141 RepID=A0ABU5QPQ3_9BACT|nr:hypothetical protein [Arcicella aquatica]MEA5259061.1 hypothetical protein [Arcicella aquatica]
MKAKLTGLFLLLGALTAQAQDNNNKVSLGGTRFTYPLIEKWITEYKKIYPKADVQLAKNVGESVTIQIIAYHAEPTAFGDDKEITPVSRFALLPVGNEKTPLAQTLVKKGVKKEELKKYFLEDPEDALEQDKDAPKYQVYTRASKVCSSISFASYLGDDAENIVGKGITGDDKNLLEAIKRDPLGITYNNLGYLYNLQTRQPLKDFTIFPIDLNNNGKLDKEEQIYGNLDLLISFLEKNPTSKAIPTENVYFITHKNAENGELKRFVNWTKHEGQAYVKELGFVGLNDANDNKSAFVESNNSFKSKN